MIDHRSGLCGPLAVCVRCIRNRDWPIIMVDRVLQYRRTLSGKVNVRREIIFVKTGEEQ